MGTRDVVVGFAEPRHDLIAPARRGRQHAVVDELTLVGEVCGRGLMIGLELVGDADKTPAVDAAKEVKTPYRDVGLLIGAGGSFANVVRNQPPLMLTETEAGRIIDSLSSVLRLVHGSL